MYSVALTIHLGVLALAIPTVLVADWYGASWQRGVRTTLDRRVLTRLHRLVLFELALMVGSGAYMASGQLGYLLYEPLFITKLVFVALLVCNAYVIGRLVPIAVETPWNEVAPHIRSLLMVSGAVSLVGWVGALTTAMIFF